MAQRGTLEYYQDIVNDTTNPELILSLIHI